MNCRRHGDTGEGSAGACIAISQLESDPDYSPVRGGRTLRYWPRGQQPALTLTLSRRERGPEAAKVAFLRGREDGTLPASSRWTEGQ